MIVKTINHQRFTVEDVNQAIEIDIKSIKWIFPKIQRKKSSKSIISDDNYPDQQRSIKNRKSTQKHKQIGNCSIPDVWRFNPGV